MPSRIQILRHQAFKRQGGRCYYCGIPMWLLSHDELPGRSLSPAAAARLKCTAEHLVPRSEGGTNIAANIVAACAHCNWTRHKVKHLTAPDAYRCLVEQRVKRGAW